MTEGQANVAAKALKKKAKKAKKAAGVDKTSSDAADKKASQDKKVKKDKVLKRVKEAAVSSESKPPVTETASEEGDKKKKKKTKSNETAVVAASDEASRADASHEKKKKSKKSKNKDKKRTAETAALDDDKAPEETNAESPKKKTKKPKQSISKEPDTAAPKESSQKQAQAGAVTTLGAKESQAYRDKHSIVVTGMDVGVVTSFDTCGFPDELVATCSNFKEPTPIQSQAWPVILSNRDLVGIAATGSGKTIAFSFPAFMHVHNKRPQKKNGDTPLVLVVAPTRELASQTADVCESVGSKMGLRSVCVYGGVDKRSQKDALRKGIDILVCTPGRLLDLHQEGACKLNKVTYLVLDEADRMLDLGFEKDIRRIISELGPQRRTCMFSATWPVSIQKLANEFLDNPVKITIGCEDLAANHNVKQTVEVVDPKTKDRKLSELLRRFHKNGNRVLVFALYKKEAERLYLSLQRTYKRGVCAIHGNMNQRERIESLAEFKSGSKPLLVATDVAARGLDIPDVEVVINYTFPLTIEDYVHRIGRTGRAGKSGISYTMFTDHDKLRAGDLQNILREAGEEVPAALMKFGSHTKRKEHKLYGAIGDKGDNTDTKVERMTFD